MMRERYLPKPEEDVAAFLDRIDDVSEVRFWFMINKGAAWFNEFHKLARVHPKIRKSYRPSMRMMEIVEMFTGGDLPAKGDRVIFEGFEFTDFDFVQTSFFASLVNCALDGSDLIFAHFKKSEWKGGSCRKAKMHGTQIEDCIVEGVDFQGTSFSNARLENSNFKNCNFQNCCFDGVVLKNADFSQSNLDQRQVYAAIGDDQTKIPTARTRPSHWGRQYVRVLRKFGDYIHVFAKNDALFYNESSDQQGQHPLKELHLEPDSKFQPSFYLSCDVA